MPELPEVETLRLQLSQLIIGKTIKSIDILKPKSFVGDKKLVMGEKIIGVRRFAKILILDLSNKLSLAIHLKMSGQLIYQSHRQLKSSYSKSEVVDVGEFLNKHTRIIITFVDGDKLFFNDQRMFGWVRILRNYPINQLSNKPINTNNSSNKSDDLNHLISRLGPDPLEELTAENIKTILKSSRRPIKLVLMDQEKIAGVGNIYANDSLFLAGINPKMQSFKASKIQANLLIKSLVKVLKDGIKWRGASKNHFRDVYGRMGEKQEHFYVYDRAGEKCINNCGEIIKKIKLGGRGTFFCPKCQKMV